MEVSVAARCPLGRRNCNEKSISNYPVQTATLPSKLHIKTRTRYHCFALAMLLWLIVPSDHRCNYPDDLTDTKVLAKDQKGRKEG